MFQQKKPDAKVAKKTLYNHLIVLGVWCLVIRAAPYVADAVSKAETRR